jgi:hypothetical protein
MKMLKIFLVLYLFGAFEGVGELDEELKLKIRLKINKIKIQKQISTSHKSKQRPMGL